MKIAILGLGIVAIADALALGRRHRVRLTGPMPDRIEAINARHFALNDPALAGYLARHPLDVAAHLDTAEVLSGAEMVCISMPLSIDPATGQIATAEIESRIARALAACPGVPVVIRSAVPFGFCARMLAQFPGAPLVYAPEFLRESSALSDLLQMRQVLVGNTGAVGARAGRVLAGASLLAPVHIRQMPLPEAEAVKHFAQALIAARIACFQEMERFATAKGLDGQAVIEGVFMDPRLGLDPQTAFAGAMGGAAALSLQAAREHLRDQFDMPAGVLPRNGAVSSIRAL